MPQQKRIVISAIVTIVYFYCNVKPFRYRWGKLMAKRLDAELGQGIETVCVYQTSTKTPGSSLSHRELSGVCIFGRLPSVYRRNFLTHNIRIFPNFLRFLQRSEPRKYRDTGVAGQKR